MCNDNLPATRQEARDTGSKHYFTGKPCKHGHISERFTSTGNCVACYKEPANQERQRQWAKNNWGKMLEYSRNWSERHKDARKAYYQSNKGKLLDESRRRYFADHEKSKKRARNRYYNNKSTFLYHNANRRAAKNKATPDWLTTEDRKNILAVYEMSRRLSECVGVEHHVDHIIPLQGKTVCGLHVPWNLAAIPATINRRKLNKVTT